MMGLEVWRGWEGTEMGGSGRFGCWLWSGLLELRTGTRKGQ